MHRLALCCSLWALTACIVQQQPQQAPQLQPQPQGRNAPAPEGTQPESTPLQQLDRTARGNAGALCPAPKQPAHLPHHASPKLVFDVPDAVDFPGMVSLLIDAKEPTRSPVPFEIEIVSPTGKIERIQIQHQNSVEVCPKCLPTREDPDSCKNVSCYWNSRGGHHERLDPRLTNEAGKYTLTLHRKDTGDKLTRTMEVGAGLSRSVCQNARQRIGSHELDTCAAATVPIGGNMWGRRARYQMRGCYSNVFSTPLSQSTQVSFERGPWQRAKPVTFPEGAVRRLSIDDGVLTAYRSKDTLYVVATPHDIKGHDELVRALLALDPPPAAKPFPIPPCIATERHQVAAEPVESITRRDRYFAEYQDNRVIGVNLLTLTQGQFFVRAGFRPGDLVYAVNGVPIDSLDKASAFVLPFTHKGTVRVTLKRKDYPNLPQFPGGVRCLVIDVQ